MNKSTILKSRERAIKPIPLAVREYGQPFLSKNVSAQIQKLQKYNFDFSQELDNDYIRMIKKYCVQYNEPHGNAVKIDDKYYSGCVSGILWWCNVTGKLSWGTDKTSTGIFNISRNKYLKEFMIENPPYFKIDNKCCDLSKKRVSSKYIKQHNIDLSIIGVRKAEGGLRATSYKNCFSEELHGCAQYRPLFWYLDSDKLDYEKSCNIIHSDCYKVWGFKRTGCVGCPYALDLFAELDIIQKFEPNMYKAVSNVFKDSYEYTKQYRQFVQDMKEKEKGRKRLF